MLITEEFKVGTPVFQGKGSELGTVVGFLRKWEETRYHSCLKLFVVVEFFTQTFGEDVVSTKIVFDPENLTVFKE